jgi:hypothetical protein
MALPDGVKRFDGAPSNPAKIGRQGGGDAKVTEAKAADRSVLPDIATFSGTKNRGADAASVKMAEGFTASAGERDVRPSGIDVEAGRGRPSARDGDSGDLI